MQDRDLCCLCDIVARLYGYLLMRLKFIVSIEISVGYCIRDVVDIIVTCLLESGCKEGVGIDEIYKKCL